MEVYNKIPRKFHFIKEDNMIPSKFPNVGENCPQYHCDGCIVLVDRGYDLPDKMSLSNMDDNEEGGRFVIRCSEVDSGRCNFNMNISNRLF